MHSGVTGNQLPVEHTFRLTRSGAWATVIVLVVLVIAWVGGRDAVLADTIWEPFVGLIAAVGWVTLGINAVNLLLLPMPRFVHLDAEGMHILWRDRIANWSWETITLSKNRAGFLQMLPAGEKNGLVLLFIPGRDLALFDNMVIHYLSQSLGQREAAQLMAGDFISHSSAQRLTALGSILFSLSFRLIIGVLVLQHCILPSQALSEITLPEQLVGVFFFILIIVDAILDVGRDLRQGWSTLRFQPEGFEETWPGGQRLIPYGSMDHITHWRKRGQQILNVRAGKQRLQINSDFMLFWGALYLLRQRAVVAQWEETSKSVRIL